MADMHVRPSRSINDLRADPVIDQLDSSQSSQTRQRIFVASLHLFALLLLGLHLYVRTLPPTPVPIPEPTDAEAAWWGLWPVTYVPGWAVGVGLILVGGLILACWSKEIGDWRLAIREQRVESRDQKVETIHLRTTHHALRTTLVILSSCHLVLFFLFPIAHTRWGDAYMLAKGIAWPDAAARTTHSWQAPLDVFLHSQVWLWLGPSFGWTDDAAPVYRLLSPLAGAIYLIVVLAISRDRRIAPGWLSLGLLMSLGLMQLFYGYVENYSFVAAGILAYLWLGIGVVHGETPLWLAAIVLAFCNAFHPSTVVLAPSLLYLGKVATWQRGRVAEWQGDTNQDQVTTNPKSKIQNPKFYRNSPIRSIVLQIGLPMILVAGATIGLMEAGVHGLNALFSSDRPGGGDARWLVPLLETSTRWEHYTLFSWLHLRDWLNGQMLVAPVVGTVLMMILLIRLLKLEIGDQRSGTRDQRLETGEHHAPRTTHHAIRTFLLIATFSYLLFTWLWNPDYGGQRDWDLFSLAALPMTLLVITWLPRILQDRYLRLGMIPLITLQALHTAAWIYQNTLPWAWPT